MQLNILTSFLEIRMLKILLLGSISGFPWVLIGSSLSMWLKDYDISRSTIGWAGLIFAVYAVNYLWAPFIDRIQIPYLSKKFGHRKSWIFSMQLLIMTCLLLWSFLFPNIDLKVIIFLGLIIALSSASQDITIDALRIEQIKKTEKKIMAAGASVTVIGWWTGYKVGGFISLSLAQFFEENGIINFWQYTFICLIMLMLLMNILLCFLTENYSEKKKKSHKKFNNEIEKKLKNLIFGKKIIAWLFATILGPLVSFFKKNGLKVALGILIFIFMFKIGEAFLGRMSLIFYKEIGFSKGDIGIFSKGIGWITTILFTILGGIFTIRSGIIKSLFLAGIIMSITNVLFSILYWYGKSYYLFAVAVVLDDIAAAFATVAFVAFISLLVDRNYTATQYALLASIGTAGRTTLASSSGSLVDWLNGDWGIFFILTSIMVIPSLLILMILKRI